METERRTQLIGRRDLAPNEHCQRGRAVVAVHGLSVPALRPSSLSICGHFLLERLQRTKLSRGIYEGTSDTDKDIQESSFLNKTGIKYFRSFIINDLL